jgi:hypothetical protein
MEFGLGGKETRNRIEKGERKKGKNQISFNNTIYTLRNYVLCISVVY